VGGYYANAARAGEAPGRWFGRGVQDLGLTEGQQIYTDAQIAAYQAVYCQLHPVTGEQLGRQAANSGQAGAERREAYGERRTWSGCWPPSRTPPPSGDGTWPGRPRWRPGRPRRIRM